MRCPLDDAWCMDNSCVPLGVCKHNANAMRTATVDSNIVTVGLMECPTYRCPCSLVECTSTRVCKYLGDPAMGNGPKLATVGFYCCHTTGQCVVQCTACKVLAEQGTGTAANATVEPATRMTTWERKKDCHTGVYYLGQCGKANIYVGKESQVARRPYTNSTRDFKLIVSLIEYGGYWSKENKGDEFLVTGNAAAKAMLPEDIFRQDTPIPFLHVSWPDYGAVALGRDWWASFVSALKRIDGDVVLYCMGGHGRTGTAASILAVLCGWVDPDYCPVAWVRDTYCAETVESEAQVEYIEEITGQKVISLPANHYGSYAQGQLWSNVTNTNPTKLTVVATEGDDDEDDTVPTLSNNQYKKFAARMRRAGHAMPTVKGMEDRHEVVVDGNLFEWNAILGKFEWLSYVGDVEDEIVIGKQGDTEQDKPDPVG